MKNKNYKVGDYVYLTDYYIKGQISKVGKKNIWLGPPDFAGNRDRYPREFLDKEAIIIPNTKLGKVLYDIT